MYCFLTFNAMEDRERAMNALGLGECVKADKLSISFASPYVDDVMKTLVDAGFKHDDFYWQFSERDIFEEVVS